MNRIRSAILTGLCVVAPYATAHDEPGHAHEHAKGHEHHDHSRHQHGHASAVILDASNWDAYAPHGKEADAIYGDAVLANSRLTAVIAAPLPTRNANMTVRGVGGMLIDLTVNDSSSDQLSCFYVLKKRFAFAGFEIESRKSQKVVDGKPSIASLALVRSFGTDARSGLKATVTYEIKDEDTFLTIRSRIENPTDAPVTFALADDLRFDAGKEAAFKAPNGPNAFHWFGDDFWGQAYAVVPQNGWTVTTKTDARVHDLAYRTSGNEKGEVALAAGAAFEFERKIYPGRDTLAIQALARADQGAKIKPVSISVKGASGAPVDSGGVKVAGPDGYLGWGRTNAEGLLATGLPVGTYAVSVDIQGQKFKENAPAKLVVDDSAKTSLDISVIEWNPGTVAATVTDGAGSPIAAKVDFQGLDGTPSPNFGPESAEFGVLNLRYTPNGKFVQTVGAGKYRAVISHGPEYDVATMDIVVKPGQETPLVAKLKRSVATPGWVSADFHSHSSPSGDNTSSQLGRVLNLVAEHVEFAPCTEHNRVETYDPEIAALKVGHAIATVSGLELTGSPLPLNHQNAFPLKYVPRTQDGGAPVTDADPSVQIQRLFDWNDGSEKLIQQNHPDIGWLFFDKDGDGVPDGGYPGPRKLMDVMEIHPIDMVTSMTPVVDYFGRESENQMFAWLQLLNQGFRIPGVVNTDAHYNYHGSGGLRNWIASSTDDPAKIDPMEMVRQSEKGRLIMSNGPYLEFKVRESVQPAEKAVIAGDDLTARSGKVTVKVRVQCPNWFDVNRVLLLVNGRPHADFDFRMATHAAAFREGALKFELEKELTLPADAHLIAVTVGEGLSIGPVVGPAWGRQMPTAVANPVFVDVDGGGFTPNKDTLGHPLPVKFAPKPR